jgi:hypothetical protein
LKKKPIHYISRLVNILEEQGNQQKIFPENSTYSILRLVKLSNCLINQRGNFNAYFGRPGGADGLASLARVSGNVARISFTPVVGYPIGESWIGASPRVHKKSRQYITDKEPTATLILSHENGYIEAKGLFDPPIFCPLYKAGRPERIPDSEYSLLNALAKSLEKHTNPAGHLLLISERIPCDSCTTVLSKFLEKHPHVTADIYYLFDTIGGGITREAWHFTNELKPLEIKSRVKLMFTQILFSEFHFPNLHVLSARFVETSDLSKKTPISQMAREKMSQPDVFLHASIQSEDYSGPNTIFPRPKKNN